MDHDGRQFKGRKLAQCLRRDRWEVILSDGANDLRHCLKSSLHIRFTKRYDVSFRPPRDEANKNTIERVI